MPVATETSLVDALPALRERCERELATLATPTCRRGCSACCEHLVPVAPAELRRLRGVVEALPAGERARLRRRFASARLQLMKAHLWDLLEDAAVAPPEEQAWLASSYRSARVPCPFLDDGECSIYDERPLACRLQAVTSDPAECHKSRGEVVPLRLPGRPPVKALAELEGGTWSPLVCLRDGGYESEVAGDWEERFGDARR